MGETLRSQAFYVKNVVSITALQGLGEDGIIITMKLGINTAVMLLASSLWAAGGDSGDFVRYQVIIDRKPFGEPPPDQAQSVASAAAAAQAELFAKSLKMVVIKIEDGDTYVGFVSQASSNKGYYLSVGEKTADGIELVDASFEQESALLKKDGQTVRIYMNGSPQKGSSTQLVVMASSKSEPVREPSFGRSRERYPDPTDGRDHSSGHSRESRERYLDIMKSRMRASQASAEQPASPAPKLTTAELDKHLKEYQMENIRKGLPALPIPLTQEMDDQLVKEGVLPPLQPAATGQ